MDNYVKISGRLGAVVLVLLSIICLALVNSAQATEEMNTSANVPLLAAQFKDVPSTDANAIYVNYLANKDIIKGYPDGGFHPNEGLTRAQAAVVMVKAAGLNVDPTLPIPFSDVDSSYWARDYIAAAAQAGYLSGYPDKSFHPDEILNRAQGISLTLRLSKQSSQGVTLPQLNDINNNHWAAPAVAVGIASGMIGISADAKQFLPDEAFTRLDLAHALGFLLTEDSGLNSTNLFGKIKAIVGSVKVKSAAGAEQEIKNESDISIGDLIITGDNSSCELSYPDGSSMLIKENTEISVKEAKGRRYIKNDGSEGTAVDWLLMDLKKGTMFGALATKHEGQNQEEPTPNNQSQQTGQIYQSYYQRVASLNAWKLLAAGNEDLPWWQVAKTPKVKVKVDMPWGVAAVRGTFFMINVNSSNQSDIGCLTGNIEVSNQGATVPLQGGQETHIGAQNSPPTVGAPMSNLKIEQFNQVKAWIQATAQNIDKVREFMTPAPPSVQANGLPLSIILNSNYPKSTVQVVDLALAGLGGGIAAPTSSNGSGGSTGNSNNSVTTVSVLTGQPISLPWGITIDLGQMNIPAGATVSIHEESNPDLGTTSLQVAGKIVDISFANLNINQPVQLSLPINQGIDPNKTAIYLYDNGNWVYQPTQYANGMLTATVSHFSIYGVLIDQNPPANVDLSEGSRASDSIELLLRAQDSSGMVQYQIYRNSVLIATTSNSSYIDSGLQSGVEYHYQIQVSDRFQNQADTIVTLDLTTCATASGLTALVAAKATPEAGKVIFTISTAAQASHKIYYKIVDEEPTAMNVGSVIDTSSWILAVDNNPLEISVADGKYIQVIEVADIDSSVSKWGKSVVTNDGYTPPVAASGLTAAVAVKATPEAGKVMLTVNPAAQAGHLIYYRVVNAQPAAMTVGDAVYVADVWYQVNSTNAFEVTAADGKYIEVIELTNADQKVSKWGKSIPTEDGYIAPPLGAASGLTASVAAKTTPEAGKVMLTVTPAAQASHLIYYRVVDAQPAAKIVGDVVYVAENWHQVSDTNAFGVAVADGKYIEVAEIKEADQKVSKWGKSAATEDGYNAVTGITGSIVLNATSYKMGELIDISVTDNDLNTDGGTQQTISVNIKSDGDLNGIAVTLIETGNNTGVFKGEVKLKKLTNAGSTPHNLRAVVGDTITATYDDNLDAVGNNPAPVTATANVTSGTTGVIILSAPSYSGGVIITLSDMDLNTNATSAQSVRVDVNSANTDTRGFQVSLTETGNNTGIFTGSIKIGPASKNNTKPKTLGAQVDEVITATFIDELDEDGETSTVVVTATVL